MGAESPLAVHSITSASEHSSATYTNPSASTSSCTVGLALSYLFSLGFSASNMVTIIRGWLLVKALYPHAGFWFMSFGINAVPLPSKQAKIPSSLC